MAMTMSTARSQTRSCLVICFIGLPFRFSDCAEASIRYPSSPLVNGADPADDTYGAGPSGPSWASRWLPLPSPAA